MIRRSLIRLHNFLKLFGLHPIKTYRVIKSFPIYFQNLSALKNQMRLHKAPFSISQLKPCLEDRFLESGVANGHYFHQDLWVARRVFLNNPSLHVDVGSRIDGFVAHVASFREIEVLDIRNINSKVPGIKFTQCDLMGSIPAELMDYCDSLSCLHAIEHFGLGRYGDAVKFDGYLDGLNNLYKILKVGGKLYISVPIGPQRVEFDAHRVFSINYFVELLSKKYILDSFSYVNDEGDLFSNVTLSDPDIQKNYNCTYGCGIFELTKK